MDERTEQQRELSVVFPAFNEAASLPGLLARCKEALGGASYIVIVVDDGSTDDTHRVAEQAAQALPVVVLRHRQNLGLCAALVTGLTRALEVTLPNGAVAVMDADGTHDPGLLPVMMGAMYAGPDVVIGSRFVRGGLQIGVPRFRRFLSWAARWTLTVLWRIPGVRDYTCGYRMYRAGLISQLASRFDPLLEAGGFAATLELLLKCARLGARVVEVPLLLDYGRKASPSKMRMMPTIWECLRLSWRARKWRKPAKIVRVGS